jgi:dienelactone hydrolase
MIHRFALLLLLVLAPSFAWAAVRAVVVRFPCDRDVCEGTLYLPEGAGPFPIVVMGHGFAGTRDVALPFFAHRMAGSGVAAFAFDYRHFGTSGGTPRQYIHPDEQIADFASAIAAMRKREDIDGARLALWGSSMGAGHALVAASKDGSVKALVLQAPLIDTAMDGEATRMGAWFAIKLVVSGWRDMLSRAIGGEGYMVPSIGKAGSFAMIADDAAHAAFQELVQPRSTYRNAVMASSIFNFKRYNPISHAGGLSMPLLVVASRNDRFAPFAAAEKAEGTAEECGPRDFRGRSFQHLLATGCDGGCRARSRIPCRCAETLVRRLHQWPHPGQAPTGRAARSV